MKKLTYLAVVLISMGFLFSCNQDEGTDPNLEGIDLTAIKSSDITVILQSAPVSQELNVTPYLIPGVNNGGNRDCEEVAVAFNTEFALCGDKIDYEEGAFVSGFPSGLNVTTDGTYVSFDIADCVEIGGMFYKVGAVIVKGSEQANVYYYPDGALFDYGLASPITSSGNPAGLSNLTFCFVPCEPQVPEFIIALKSYITWDNAGEITNTFAVSGGTVYPNEVLGIGYNSYVSGVPATYPFYRAYGTEEIGEVHVMDYMENGMHYLRVEVVVTSADDWFLTESDLYVGSQDGLENYLVEYNNDPPKVIFQYWFFPFRILDNVSKTHVFTIDYADITE